MEILAKAPLLGERPLVISGPAETRQPGKDTARFWEAGAAMVHWVVATDEQVADGIKIALSRVEHEGVLIEGGSFLKHIDADYSIMVASPPIRDIKSSAVRVMPKMNLIYVNRSEPDASVAEDLRERLSKRGVAIADAPIYFERDLPHVAREVMKVHRARTLSSCQASTKSDGLDIDSSDSDGGDDAA